MWFASLREKRLFVVALLCMLGCSVVSLFLVVEHANDGILLGLTFKDNERTLFILCEEPFWSFCDLSDVISKLKAAAVQLGFILEENSHFPLI